MTTAMRRPLISAVLLLISSWTYSAETPVQKVTDMAKDYHSFANPEHIKVRHADLSLKVQFDKHTLEGYVTLDVERTSKELSQPLVLDSRDLNVTKTESSTDGSTFAFTTFNSAARHPLYGTAISITVPPDVKKVRVHYSTSPKASGLQWLAPSQTAGKKHPFLFTQSQAIHARSWIPLQDSPGVRITYSATIQAPKELLVVMSAAGNAQNLQNGEYHFELKHAIPSYLIALAVGDLEFRALSNRTGVYAEPSVVGAAASEFVDMESMVHATEEMYGAYRWGRYDILVLPPSFPFGGMENPCLTFATPTILAGDRSLVSLVAHELAHSWSGNLVTNATWRDFWLNEGFTVYLERRILEKLYGKVRAEREAVLGRQDLEKEMKELDAKSKILYIDLSGQDPDDGVTSVPYEKGALFLMHLEKVVGRDAFDKFLKSYFDHFAFQSITTPQFVEYLQATLVKDHPEVAKQVPITEWITQSEIPKSSPRISSESLAVVDAQAKEWLERKKDAASLATKEWTTQEWLHFLRFLPKDLAADRMKELDAAFSFSKSGNSEIVFQWLEMSIWSNYEPAFPKLEEFLTTIGRRKFVKPLYEDLIKTEAGKKKAMAIYEKARPMYHPITQMTVDDILKWKPEAGKK